MAPELEPLLTLLREDLALRRTGWVFSGEKDRRRAISLVKFGYDPRHEDRFLGLAVSAPYRDIVAETTGVYFVAVNIIGVVFLVMSAAAFVWSARRTRSGWRGPHGSAGGTGSSGLSRSRN